MDQKNFHMTSDEFRKYGYALVDWMVNYRETVEQFPVLSQVSPGEIRKSLHEKAPLQGESMDNILKDFNEKIIPGITHWQSPNFYAYFPSNTSEPSILAEMLVSSLGAQGMLWATSPSCTELETHVLDWLVDMLALPQKFKSTVNGGGVIQDSASSATLCALIAAREKTSLYKTNERGCKENYTVYISSQVHASIEKAVKIVGIGRENIRFIDVDKNFALDPKHLEEQIQKDKEIGNIPCFVCATVGTTSSNAIDPVAQIGEICRREKIWLHVDAAMSGTAAICPEYRHIHNGIELANSYCFNPHKWMFTNFACNCFYIENRKELIDALDILPEYLRNKTTDTNEVIDYRNWQIPLGRKFRSLKLWFVIRYYGIEGLQYHIKEHISIAQEFAQWIKNSQDFELTITPPLNLVCFRHKLGDDLNQKLLETLNKSGKLYLTHTKLNEQFVLRLCVGQTKTTHKHVWNAWQEIQRIAQILAN